MASWFAGAGAALLAFAGWAAFMDRRRANRAALDKVGWVNWPLALVLALIGAMICAILAFHV